MDLTAEQIAYIRELRTRGYSLEHLASLYSYVKTPDEIRAICESEPIIHNRVDHGESKQWQDAQAELSALRASLSAAHAEIEGMRGERDAIKVDLLDAQLVRDNALERAARAQSTAGVLLTERDLARAERDAARVKCDELDAKADNLLKQTAEAWIEVLAWKKVADADALRRKEAEAARDRAAAEAQRLRDTINQVWHCRFTSGMKVCDLLIEDNSQDVQRVCALVGAALAPTPATGRGET